MNEIVNKFLLAGDKFMPKKIIRKFLKRKVYSSFRDNIWGC